MAGYARISSAVEFWGLFLLQSSNTSVDIPSVKFLRLKHLLLGLIYFTVPITVSIPIQLSRPIYYTEPRPYGHKWSRVKCRIWVCQWSVALPNFYNSRKSSQVRPSQSLTVFQTSQHDHSAVNPTREQSAQICDAFLWSEWKTGCFAEVLTPHSPLRRPWFLYSSAGSSEQ